MISSPIEEIKNRLDVVEVIGGYIRLQKAGANYRACCPFHSEKKPSFFVSPARQIWHCFGCSKGGDIFGFVKEIEGVEFGDALRILAQRAGVELKKQTKEEEVFRSEREKLYEICELATKFFEKQLWESKSGEAPKSYLLERGIKEESLKKWRIGYAPDVWQGLSDFLDSRGYTKQEIEKAGLALTSEQGSFYDRFRGRIIFPVFDLNSQVVGFGGRVFKDKDNKEIAKYVNTPQTLVYDKGRTLYGLDKAKVEIRKKDSCIMVEGYVDLIMVSQAGFENVVATSGTALTPFQLKILKRYTENLLSSFDMDVAGDAATKRGIDLAQAQGFNVKVITIPEGKDPADAVLKDPKIWEESVKGAKTIMDFYFETTFSKFDKESSDGKREISKILLPVIKRLPNKIVQAHWTGEMAKRFRVKEESIEEELKKVKLDGYSEAYGLEKEEIAAIVPKSRKEMLEERLVVSILKFPAKKESINKDILDILTEETRKVVEALLKGEKPDSEIFNKLALMAEIEETGERELELELEKCLEELNSLSMKVKMEEMHQELKKAEEDKDQSKIDECSKKFNQLTKEKCQK